MNTAVAPVERAVKLCNDVDFSAGNALRTEPEFLVEVVNAAVLAGATALNSPDTVGFTAPSEIVALFEYLRRHVRGAATQTWIH